MALPPPPMKLATVRTLLCLLSSLLPGLAAETGHPLRGVVTRVLAPEKLVLVQHEEIPGFMGAMTMAFRVPDAVWPQLTPGTRLTATLQGAGGAWRLEDVHVIAAPGAAPAAAAAPAEPGYPLASALVPVPARPGARGVSLARSSDGAVYLTWLEPRAPDQTALCLAQFDAGRGRWGPARTIATGRDWFVNWADFPSLAAEPGGRLTAVWSVNQPVEAPAAAGGAHAHEAGYQAWISQSPDAGATWSPPARLTRESASVEFVALQPLARGGVLAVWLDGRGRASGGQAQQLYGRLVGGEGPDQRIDGSVCDCCQTTLTAFPNGSALVAYRARRDHEVRDIHTALYHLGQWQAPRVLSPDNWRIDGCPVNGPQLDSVGGQVAAAWFTAAGQEPRVLASRSPDAGARFTQPLRLDLGRPLGRVDTLLLRDGSRLVVWLEAAGETAAGLYLRRLSPADEVGPAVLLAESQSARASGFPRLALVKDYDATPAQVLLAYNQAAAPGTVHTRLLTLPALSALTGRAPCLPCDEADASAVRGYPIRGRVLGADPDRRQILVQHEEIPGVMRAMTMEFGADPEVVAAALPGRELLGRIERREKTWWIFGVKWLGDGRP